MSGETFNLHVVVSGVVQGVGFRYFTCRVAGAYGLVGYVRNRPDGRVEIEAEGPRGPLNAFLQEVRRGPAFGHVAAVEERWRPATGRYTRFEIRR